MKDAFFDGSERLDWTATYSRSGTKVFVRLLGFRAIPGLHFHIDLSPASAFSGGVPKPTHKLNDLHDKLSTLEGRMIDVVAIASWIVPATDLSAGRRYPWASDVRIVSGGLSMKLIGAEFEITGGGIKRFQWSWEKGENRDSPANLILETLSVRHRRVLDPSYVTAELSQSEFSLRTAILGEDRLGEPGAHQ